MAMRNAEILELRSPDAEVVAKVKAGEKDLFELLIRRYNGALYKVGRAYGFGHDDVQDLMQETHLAAYRNLHKFEERSTYKTWLIRIMLNKCYHQAQKNARQSQKFLPEELVANLTLPTENLPFSDGQREIMNRELGRVLEKCIETLPANLRTVFVLRELEGMNVLETAEALHISEANVKVRLNRARNLLRKQLENWYPQAAVYEFNLIYCDKIVEGVFRKMQEE